MPRQILKKPLEAMMWLLSRRDCVRCRDGVGDCGRCCGSCCWCSCAALPHVRGLLYQPPSAITHACAPRGVRWPCEAGAAARRALDRGADPQEARPWRSILDLYFCTRQCAQGYVWLRVFLCFLSFPKKPIRPSESRVMLRKVRSMKMVKKDEGR